MNDKKAPNIGKGVLLIAADILLIAFFVMIAIRVYTGGGGIGGLLFTALVGFLVSFGLTLIFQFLFTELPILARIFCRE